MESHQHISSGLSCSQINAIATCICLLYIWHTQQYRHTWIYTAWFSCYKCVVCVVFIPAAVPVVFLRSWSFHLIIFKAKLLKQSVAADLIIGCGYNGINFSSSIFNIYMYQEFRAAVAALMTSLYFQFQSSSMTTKLFVLMSACGSYESHIVTTTNLILYKSLSAGILRKHSVTFSAVQIQSFSIILDLSLCSSTQQHCVTKHRSVYENPSKKYESGSTSAASVLLLDSN